jgi:hypothetical protein
LSITVDLLDAIAIMPVGDTGLTICTPKYSLPDFKLFSRNTIRGREHMQSEINKHVERIAGIKPR